MRDDKAETDIGILLSALVVVTSGQRVIMLELMRSVENVQVELFAVLRGISVLRSAGLEGAHSKRIRFRDSNDTLRDSKASLEKKVSHMLMSTYDMGNPR